MRPFILNDVCILPIIHAQYTRLPNADTLLSSLDAVLSSSRPDDAIQEELLDLIGFDHLDLITDVLQERSAVAREVRMYQE